MDDVIADILFEIEQAGGIILPISDRIVMSSRNAKRFNLSPLAMESQVYLGSGRPCHEIPVGMKFEVLFNPKKPKEYLKCYSVLKYVKVSPSYESQSLPNGYSGICLMEFLDAKPGWVDRLPMEGDAYNRDNLSLYFTTQLVMDLILARLEMHP